MKLSVANQRVAEKNFKLLKDDPQHPSLHCYTNDLDVWVGYCQKFHEKLTAGSAKRKGAEDYLTSCFSINALRSPRSLR